MTPFPIHWTFSFLPRTACEDQQTFGRRRCNSEAQGHVWVWAVQTQLQCEVVQGTALNGLWYFNLWLLWKGMGAFKSASREYEPEPLLLSLCSFTLPIYHSRVFIYCICILDWKLIFSVLAQNVSTAVTDLQSCASLHTKQYSPRIYSLFGKCDLKGSLNFLCPWQSSSLSLDSHFRDQLWHFMYLSWGSADTFLNLG